jgi:hypothetical protein
MHLDRRTKSPYIHHLAYDGNEQLASHYGHFFHILWLAMDEKLGLRAILDVVKGKLLVSYHESNTRPSS